MNSRRTLLLAFLILSRSLLSFLTARLVCSRWHGGTAAQRQRLATTKATAHERIAMVQRYRDPGIDSIKGKRSRTGGSRENTEVDVTPLRISSADPLRPDRAVGNVFLSRPLVPYLLRNSIGLARARHAHNLFRNHSDSSGNICPRTIFQILRAIL